MTFPIEQGAFARTNFRSATRDDMSELVAVFILGLLSSAHCVGMCGGFAAAISATGQPIWPMLARQLIYSAGRLSTYAFLGAVGGAAGLYVAQFNTSLVNVQRTFSILAGVMMILIGASVLGLLRLSFLSKLGLETLFAPMFRQFLNARSVGGFFLAGLANGFLPCGLVYAFLAKAVAGASVGYGAAIMLAFGLGTVPAMVAIGCGSALLSRTVRHRVYQFAACMVIVVGVVTISRAIPHSGEEDCCDDIAASMADVEPPSR